MWYFPSENWSFLFPSSGNHRCSVGKYRNSIHMEQNTTSPGGGGDFPAIYEFPWFLMTLCMVYNSCTTGGWKLSFPGPSSGGFPVGRAFWLTNAGFFFHSWVCICERKPTCACRGRGWEGELQRNNLELILLSIISACCESFNKKSLPTHTGIDMHVAMLLRA